MSLAGTTTHFLHTSPDFSEFEAIFQSPNGIRKQSVSVAFRLKQQITLFILGFLIKSCLVCQRTSKPYVRQNSLCGWVVTSGVSKPAKSMGLCWITLVRNARAWTCFCQQSCRRGWDFGVCGFWEVPKYLKKTEQKDYSPRFHSHTDVLIPAKD